MNKKHINAQLCKVFKNFIETIEDEEVKKIIANGTVITGGSIVSLLQGEKPHDYDLYFKDFETCYKVAEYFVNQFNESHEKKFEIRIQDADFIDRNKSYEHEGKWINYEVAKKTSRKR